jgi:hypothetical protein
MPDVITSHTQSPAEVGTPPADRRPRATDRIPAETSVALGVAWFVCYSIGSALEPHTEHAMPVIAVVLGVALLAGILTTAVGLSVRRRWGLTASLASAGLLVASSVACPTTGHHDIGLWWAGQMVVSLALVVASIVALQRRASA